MQRILFLYTEIAPYFMACLDALVNSADVEVTLVRWPRNSEAPFTFRSSDQVIMYERDRSNDEWLFELIERIQPSIVFASGWVDKGYLKVCRAMRKKNVPTVMCSDTAWRGDAKQLAAVVASRLWMSGTFSHAWVTGEAQKRYALKLGFAEKNIRMGFYSADTHLFLQHGRRLLEQRQQQWPHRFLCVARYIPTKGHQYLCDAFAELCNAGEAGDWELWIAGGGELLEQVKSSPSGRHERIKHLGFLQTHEMISVLQACSVFVLPSTYEPWGVVVHEHTCAGYPMLLSSAVGAGERFLAEGENGHRFIAGDKGTLKNMMRMIMLSSAEELRSMGQRSAELGAQWTPEQWAGVVKELMQQRA